MEFYQACGFRQINLQDTTGIELLPKTIADTLMDETSGGFAWIVPESDEPSDETFFRFPFEQCS